MKLLLTAAIVCAACSAVLHAGASKVAIESDGGYSGIVVRIADRVPEENCPLILANIKVRKVLSKCQSSLKDRHLSSPETVRRGLARALRRNVEGRVLQFRQRCRPQRLEGFYVQDGDQGAQGKPALQRRGYPRKTASYNCGSTTL